MNEAAIKPGACRFHRAAKALVVLFFALHTFHMEFIPCGDGIDSSWQYLINDAAHKGRAFAFTCGPYGFINYPLNVGSNLDSALIVRLLFWLGFTALFGGLVWRHYFSLLNAAIFVLALALLGPLSYDYFLCLMGLFLLALALEAKPWRRLYSSVLALSAFLALMKLSAGLLMLSSCIVFVGLNLFSDKKKAFQALLLTLAGLPLFFGFFYFGYDPSLSGLLAYVRWSYEIASGFSVAMSLNGRQADLWLALLVALTYLVILLLLYALKERSYKAALLFIPPLFFAFKHGFVRQDEHILYFFTWAPLLMGLVLLFTPLRRQTTWLTLLFLCALNCSLSVLGYSHSLLNMTGYSKLASLRQTLEYSQSKEALNNAAKSSLAAYALPEEWRRAIGQQLVSIFPSEAAYAQANHLNFQSFPVIQAYAAYTRNLDRWNAGFLANPQTAPKFILMQWQGIDNRHVLMDVPATWLALFQWYEAAAQRDSPHLLGLLKRRTEPRFHQLAWLERKAGPISEAMEIPRAAHPVVMKVSLRLTFAGQLAKFFFRVPKVDMELIGPHGRSNHQIVPDTLENGLFINYLPLTQSDLHSLLADQPSSGRIDRIQLKGEGLSCYQKRLQVEFYTIPETPIRELQPAANRGRKPD